MTADSGWRDVTRVSAAKAGIAAARRRLTTTLVSVEAVPDDVREINPGTPDESWVTCPDCDGYGGRWRGPDYTGPAHIDLNAKPGEADRYAHCLTCGTKGKVPR